MAHGSNIIGKLFGKHKKEEHTSNTLSHAGKSEGASEIGKHSAKTNASTSFSSNEEVYHGNGAAGQIVSSVPFDTAKHGSSKGQVVSLPPRVNRQPLDQTYGGDYADGKTPTEVSTYTSKAEDDKGLIDNHSPRYDNEAAIKKGQGQFFDPRDTQGGLYKSGAGEHEYSGKKEAPVGAAAAAASAALAGGVAKGEYGKDSEATHAQLHQKNLKTQPSAYIQQEEAKKYARELEAKAFDVGKEKGAYDAQKSQQSHDLPQSKTFDPKSEHKKNRSAYNEGGLAGATAEAKRVHEQFSAGSNVGQSTGLSSNKGASIPASGSKETSTPTAGSKYISLPTAGKKDASVTTSASKDASVPTSASKDASVTTSASKDASVPTSASKDASVPTSASKNASIPVTGNYQETKLASEQPSGHTQKKTLDPIADSEQVGAKSDQSKETPVNVATYQKTTIVNVHSPQTTNYDDKIERLDKSIAETQKEIEALEKKSADVRAEPSIHPHGTKESATTDLKSANKGVIGAAAAAVGLGGAGYAGHKESEKPQSHSSTDPKSSTIAQASVPSGQPTHVNTHADSAKETAKSTGPNVASSEKPSEKRSPTSEIETAAYNAGHAKGFTSKEAAGAKDGSSVPTNETTGSANPGLLGGIAGAATAAGAVAASAVGLSGEKEHDDKTDVKNDVVKDSKKAATDSVTADDGTLKADVDNSYYNAGYAKGQAEKDLKETKQETKEAKETPRAIVSEGSHSEPASHAAEGGYLDSAKAAIASAGVAAAGAFGYEGYNKYYNSEEHTKDVINERENDDSLLASSQKKSVEGLNDSQTKPSATSSSVQHPGATATSGASALAKDKDSRDDISADKNESTENKSEGLLSKLGLGSTTSESEKTKGVDGASEKEAHGKNSAGIGATVAGAVAGAAGAVGLSNTSKPHKVDSLVEEAASEFDDVRKEPRHNNDGGVLDDSSNSKSVPDDLDPSKQKASEAETSGVDNTKLEADIAAYNKKHGFTEKKSLIEVAEEKHPEIKQEASHHKSEDILANEEGSLGGPAQGGIAGGLAATAAGKKLLDSEEKGHKAQGKDVTKSAETSEKDILKPFESAAAGKSKGESDEIESAAHRHSSAHPVASAAVGKSRDESKEIEEAAFKASESLSHPKSPLAKNSGVVEKAKGGEAKHAEAPSQTKSELESYSLPAATGKSRQESAEIEQAAHLAGAEKARSSSKPVAEAATGKTKAESKEIELAAFKAGTGAVAGAGVGSIVGSGATHRKSSVSEPTNGSVVGKNKGESTEIQEAAQLPKGRRGSQPINGSVVGRNRSDSIEIQEAAQSLSGKQVSPPVTGSVVGKNRRDSIEIQEAAQFGGARRSSLSKPVTEAAAGKSKDESREIEGAAFAANKKAVSSPQQPTSPTSASSASRPVIEVIGIPDRDEAQKVAQQTTRELLKKGEDLSGSKIIIDANKKEVYKESQTSTHLPESAPKSTSGSSGAYAGDQSGSQEPDVSYFDAQKEVDGSKNHKEHEKVKQTLAHEAEKGKLGNVPAESEQTTTRYHLPEGCARGFAPNPLGAGERQHSYSHRNDLSGKETTYTEVTVLGEPDTKRAQVLAQDAIASLQGRKDILGTKELRVDAHTGAITDQDGLFVAQLSQRRLSQVEGLKRRTSSGGLVNLTSDYGVTSSTSPVSQHQVPRALDEKTGLKSSTKSPFQTDYNLSSAQTTAKTDSGNKMPGAFF